MKKDIRTKKMERLVLENKSKKDIESIIEIYKEQLGIYLTEDHFLKLNESNNILSLVYRNIIFQYRNEKHLNYNDIIKRKEIMVQQLTKKMDDQCIILNQNINGGENRRYGIKLKLKECIHLLESTERSFCDGKLTTDVVIVSNELKYGFAIEVEEHAYLFTKWGIVNEHVKGLE
ncbi:hypothetical protein IC619_012855 [Hazenella sp. IB182353]|uniref:YxiF family protein n=1 Tax=Polycladospora coralii TaxID=2771432 RepID=UPI00174732F5|nr:hypothetical protein [Polycladospora coralii]MBS7531383.1 hypothetical protein [Polycladospora coralii]